MPLKPYTPADPALAASHLPEGLRWLGGAALGGLNSVLGGDDPASQLMSPVTPMSVVESPTGAIRELLNIIKSYKLDPMAKLAESKVTGVVAPPTKLRVPEGFTLPEGMNPPTIQRPAAVVRRRQIEQDLFEPIKAEQRAGARGGGMPIPPEIERWGGSKRVNHQAPSIRGLEDLRNITSKPEASTRKPTIREIQAKQGTLRKPGQQR